MNRIIRFIVAVVCLAGTLSACGPLPQGASYFTPRPYDMAGLMRRSTAVPVDSEQLRHVAALAGLPVPDRPLVVFVVPGRAFPCGQALLCNGWWIAGDSGAADFIFVGAEAPSRTLQHEFLHFITRDGRHGRLFWKLSLRDVSDERL